MFDVDAHLLAWAENKFSPPEYVKIPKFDRVSVEMEWVSDFDTFNPDAGHSTPMVNLYRGNRLVYEAEFDFDTLLQEVLSFGRDLTP